MTDIYDKNVIKNALALAYGKLYEKIGIIHSSEIGDDISRKKSILLKDIFVSLRSNYLVGFKMKNGLIEEVILNKEVSNRKLDFNQTNNAVAIFIEQIKEKISLYIHNEKEKVDGVSVNKRPLVFAPIWEDGYKENFGFLDVTSALCIYDKVVLLGSPGSGKSTTAKMIAISLIQQFIESNGKDSQLSYWSNLNPQPLPILVEVRDFAMKMLSDTKEQGSSEIFLKYLQKFYLEENEILNDYFLKNLSEGGCILIFDGLDEIAVSINNNETLNQKRDQIRATIESITRRFSKCRVIVTSRFVGYSDWQLKNYEIVNIMPLNDTEVKRILVSLFIREGIEKDLIEKKCDLLLNHLQKIPKKLREQPLFIVLLGLIYLDNEELPKSRSEILSHSIKVLLKSWSKKYNSAGDLSSFLGCSENDLQMALENIAYKSLSEGNLTAYDDEISNISKALIINELFEMQGDATAGQLGAILSYISINAGILNSPDAKNYKFAHRLFQEYLAASWISNQKKKEDLLVGLLEKSFITWQEVTLIFADMLVKSDKENDLWALIDKLSSIQEKWSILILAKIIIEQKISFDSEKRWILTIIHELRNTFIKTLSSDSDFNSIERVEIALALNNINDTREGVSLDNNLIPNIKWCLINPQEKVHIGLNLDQIPLLNIDSNQWSFSREQPSFLIDLKPFAISYYPITVKQFQAFIDDDLGYNNDLWWTNEGKLWKIVNFPPNTNNVSANLPQNNVSWYEAVAFCNWLASKINKPVRLPTEIEWEATAKRLTNSLFPWGNDISVRNKANTLIEGFDSIIPVGCFDYDNSNFPTDMIGNIWEWCSTKAIDENGNDYKYPYTSLDGREDIEGSANIMRITRGGHYKLDYSRARCSYRGRDLPSVKFERQGFRVAMDL